MVTKAQIEQFYKDVDRLGLKFPVGDISKATGEGKGNVSSYLSKKLSPSESFLNKFYERFKKELEEKPVDFNVDRDKIIAELQKDVIKLEARVNVLMITLADIVSKVDNKAIAIVDSELTEATNREAKALLEELKKKWS
jgi:hypothetical protein